MTTNNYFSLITKGNRVVDHIFFNDQSADSTIKALRFTKTEADRFADLLGSKPRIVVWSKRRWPDILSQIKEVGEPNAFPVDDEDDD